jgi:hypothetical protein
MPASLHIPSTRPALERQPVRLDGRPRQRRVCAREAALPTATLI